MIAVMGSMALSLSSDNPCEQHPASVSAASSSQKLNLREVYPATQAASCSFCLSRPHQMEGWLTIANKYQSVRFHPDPNPSVSAKDVLVIVDHIKDMPEGHPPLLKTRRNMRYEDAVALWKELQRCGWTVTEAAW